MITVEERYKRALNYPLVMSVVLHFDEWNKVVGE